MWLELLSSWMVLKGSILTASITTDRGGYSRTFYDLVPKLPECHFFYNLLFKKVITASIDSWEKE